MKSMLDTILSGKYDPRSFDSQTGNQLKAFAMQASGDPGDTAEDRWALVFSRLRTPLTEHNWFISRDLRAFLVDTVNINPFIPQAMRELHLQACPGSHTIATYIESWRRENPDFPIDPFKINLDDFIRTIRLSSGVAERFAKGNLHDHDYYFLKYTEWYISSWMCRLYGYKNILDIGSNSRMFGDLITGIIPGSRITLLDLAYKPGVKKVSDRMTEIGADAGDMKIVPASSMDYVCLHNAFEHFCEDSDSRSILEIQRILRPGGRAVIVPIAMSPEYSIMINPVACFYAQKNNYFENILQEEAREHGAHIRFTTGFVSPFARVYSAQQMRTRVLAQTKDLQTRLCVIGFEDTVPAGGTHPELIYGQQLKYDIFTRHFYYTFLEFVKREAPAF